MRLPTLEKNYWHLLSGEQLHHDHPDSFWIPPRDDREQLRIGQAVKLYFEIQSETDAGETTLSSERMWVIVAERVSDGYIGILDNQPASIESSDEVYLCFGAEIPFFPEHVIDIADPPTDYVQWQLAQPPERQWRRD
jgi:hypothetical protein